MLTPLCPSCFQPASKGLGGTADEWHCANEACPEFGQVITDSEVSLAQLDEHEKED